MFFTQYFTFWEGILFVTDTCDDCEPGVVLAKVQSAQVQPKDVVRTDKSAKDLHRQKMQEIKKKYGLIKEQYVGPAAVSLPDPDYVDRSRVLSFPIFPINRFTMKVYA